MDSTFGGRTDQQPSDERKKRNGKTPFFVTALPIREPKAGGQIMISGTHFTEHCEKFLDLVEEAAELLHAKANNYVDMDLSRAATALLEVSYQLRKEVLVDKATTILASALISDANDPYEIARPIISQIKEIDQAYKDYRAVSGTDDCVEI